MSETDRLKWDERYCTGSYVGREHPTALLAEWEPQLPRGRALDVACGAGRNSLFLAATGRRVDAIDISPVGLERAKEAAERRGLEIRWIEADLEANSRTVLPPGPYDLIVLVRYVNRDLLPHLLERLDVGGVLLCEQHVDSTEEVVGPTTPAFRLRHNELLRDAMRVAEPDHGVLYYREGVVTDPDGRRAALSQLVMCRKRLVDDDSRA
ncbi:MAG: class I SAM-dependent methyltransferase [Woeseia sp.]